MSCKNGGCKEPIFQNQRSVIGKPECTDDCPEDINCNGEIVSSDCVTVNADLSCIDTEVGAVLTDVLVAINTKICDNLTSTCTASVSAGDNCCGYLSDKITGGDGIQVNVIDNAGCQTLVISETCWTWTNVAPQAGGLGQFQNGWRNANGNTVFAYATATQVAGFSNIKECTVKLRGTVYKSITTQCSNIGIFQLPVGKRPEADRIFSVNLFAALLGDCVYSFPAIIKVDTNGLVSLSAVVNVFSPAGVNYFVSLDSIFFEV